MRSGGPVWSSGPVWPDSPNPALVPRNLRTLPDRLRLERESSPPLAPVRSPQPIPALQEFHLLWARLLPLLRSADRIPRRRLFRRGPWMKNPPRILLGRHPDPWSLPPLHLDLVKGPWGGMALPRRVMPLRGRDTGLRRHLVAGLALPTAASLSSSAIPAFTSAGALSQSCSLF